MNLIIFIRKLQVRARGPMSRRQSHVEIQRGNLSMSIRTALVVLLVLGASALARPAHAQAWSEPVCMDPSSIPGLFSAMDFSGTEKCESHCKYTGNLCKTFAKDAASCNQTDAKGYWNLLDNIECDTGETLAQRRECHGIVNMYKAEAKDSINGAKAEAVAQCELETQQCIMDCAVLVLSE